MNGDPHWLSKFTENVQYLIEDRDNLQAEVAELKAQVKQLQAANDELEFVLEGLRGWGQDGGTG